MPKNWDARDNKLNKRRGFMPDNRRSIDLIVASKDKRDKMLEERARKREERRERRSIHRESTQYTY
jgi:hypothetical protein